MIITVLSSNGEYRMNELGGVISAHATTFYLPEIIRFDVDEWRDYWQKPLLPTIDILDLGYWYRKEDGSSGYEPAEMDWRKEIREGIL